MTTDIFEQATRKKLRWDSMLGGLSVEQVWELPLVANKADRPDLDKLARAVHAELKSVEEGSFVTLKPDPRKGDLELRLEILKHVIKVKLADQENAKKRLENVERKRKLLNALAAKDEQALVGMSREQIEAEIAKLTD